VSLWRFAFLFFYPYTHDFTSLGRIQVNLNQGNSLSTCYNPTLQRRNVLDHLPEEHKPAVKKKLQNAYAMTEYADWTESFNIKLWIISAHITCRKGEITNVQHHRAVHIRSRISESNRSNSP
jgi:hypothetical protein